MIWIILLSTLVCIGIIFLLVMYTEATRNTVLEHTLIFEEFPKSFQKVNIFFISDIHRRGISNSLIEQVKGKVDLVIIGGDLAEKRCPFIENLCKYTNVKSDSSCIFCMGK